MTAKNPAYCECGAKLPFASDTWTLEFRDSDKHVPGRVRTKFDCPLCGKENLRYEVPKEGKK